MPVEFVITTLNLRQATDQLKANRGAYSQSDFVDISVSESAAIFRAVGTESEAPVNGKIPGSVRVPLRTLEKITQAVNTFKKKDLSFHCKPGVIKIGTWSVKSPDIKAGTIPEQRLALPINLSLLDTLALTKVLSPRQIAQEDMQQRVQEATATRARAVEAALAALQPLEITERQLQGFVDAHIKDSAEQLRKAIWVE